MKVKHKKIAKFFAWVYRVGLTYFNDKNDDNAGYASYKTNGKCTIMLSERIESEQLLLSVIFHELGHCYCNRNRIYPAYHQPEGVAIELGSKAAKAMILTAWKAECYVDRWAMQEMKIWFPEVEYICSYLGRKGAKENFHRDHLSQFKLKTH